jgi:hypothetical protein
MEILLLIIAAVTLQWQDRHNEQIPSAASQEQIDQVASSIYANDGYTLDEDGGVVITDAIWP